MIAAILAGFFVGLIGSIPLAGPVAVLVFTRAVEGRMKSAMLIGAGCAVAEAGYAALAFWGFATLLTEVTWIEPAAKALAAVALLVVGIALVRRRSPGETDEASAAAEADEGGGFKSFLVGFGLTALNPTLLATWATVATTLFSSGWVAFEPSRAVPFGLAVGGGVGVWYLIVAELVGRFRGRIKPGTMTRVIQVIGGLLALAGGWFAVSFFVTYVF